MAKKTYTSQNYNEAPRTLGGHPFYGLILDDEQKAFRDAIWSEDMQFRCLVQELTPIHHVWLPMAFEAKIICDCPYAYSYPFEKSFQVNGETKVRFYNDSTCREYLRPTVIANLAAGCTDFSIKNNTVGREETKFADLPSGGLTIHIDNENGVITEEVAGYDLYDSFNFQFLELEPGDNELILSGVGLVTIKGRYLYNVGA